MSDNRTSKARDQQKRISELEDEVRRLRDLLARTDPILGTGKIKRTNVPTDFGQQVASKGGLPRSLQNRIDKIEQGGA